jgi:dTDP-4-dehydrorhamnose reductase
VKPRLLVTGAAGFLGWQVSRKAAGSWQVFGLCHTHRLDFAGVVPIFFDLLELSRMTALFEEIRPDGVIHTAAASDPNFCEGYPVATRPVNVDVPERLSGFCADRGIPFLFTSSDLVFDGESSPYGEDDPTGPVCIYGDQKATAEKKVLARNPDALVCRLPLLFGASGSIHTAFDYRMRQALGKKEPLRLFRDEFRTPVDAGSAAAGLLQFLGREKGMLHLGGRERISRLDMGRRLARLMGVASPAIVAVSQAEVRMPAPRAADVSLDSSRAFGLGYDPKGLDAALEEALDGRGIT